MQKKTLFLITLFFALFTTMVSYAAAGYIYYSPSPEEQKEITNLTRQLQEQQVQVIQEGDQLRLILPTDIFFDPLTIQLSQQRASTLALVAQLLNLYGNSTIEVVGHSDNVGSLMAKLNRTYQMAHNLSAYLWANGVPLYRMKVIGCADLKPIATNKSPLGSLMNRRVEILVG